MYYVGKYNDEKEEVLDLAVHHSSVNQFIEFDENYSVIRSILGTDLELIQQPYCLNSIYFVYATWKYMWINEIVSRDAFFLIVCDECLTAVEIEFEYLTVMTWSILFKFRVGIFYKKLQPNEKC